MKHKKLIIMMAVVVIMATFTINTFAEMPTEAVTGYYFIYEGYSANENQVNNQISFNSIYGADPTEEKLKEYIAFIKVNGDFYFIDSIDILNGDYMSLSVNGTGEVTHISFDILDASTTSPTGATIYWTNEAQDIVTGSGNIVDETITSTFNPTIESNNIYADIYGMVQQYIFGGVELSANQDLVATLTATWSCILLVMLPFIIVWGIFKFIVR